MRRVGVVAGVVLGVLLAGVSPGGSSGVVPAEPERDRIVRPMPAGPIYGVTTDDGYSPRVLNRSARRLARTPTTRIVFDEGIGPRQYAAAVRSMRRHSYLLGQILDSSGMRDYSVVEYRQRVANYLRVMGDDVDLWEIGNEVNGEWLGPSRQTSRKIGGAYDLATRGGHRTVLTPYYNPGCAERPGNRMFPWLRQHVPDRVKQGVDYVLISYYEHACGNHRFDVEHWTGVFERLRTIFPHSQIGFGEVGTRPGAGVRKKAATMRRYYGLPIDVEGYVGGYFWWYYRQDCIPWHQRRLWRVLDAELQTY